MKKISISFFAFFLFVACGVQKSNINSGHTEEIVILHTNDIHGNIDNFPRLSFMVDSIRAIHKNVILLNAGDIFTGNPYVDMHQDKGFPMIDLMNDIGFELTALGNHEFDYGQEILNKRMEQARFPFICANIQFNGSILKKLEGTYQFTTPQKSVINLFSLIETGENGIPSTHPARLDGLSFINGVEKAKEFKYLRNNSNIFLLLSHLGIENDEVLAKEMPELDLIVGGHSHTSIKTEKLVNGVLITQAGGRLRYLGEIKLVLQNGKVITKNSKLLPVDKTGSINNKMKEKVDNFNRNPFFDEVLGRASDKMDGVEELGSFVTDAYRAYGNYDISFQNSGGIRIPYIDQGDITRGLIFKLDPFGNGLVKLEMSFEEIKSLLLNSFRRSEIDLRVSGIHYTYKVSNGELIDVIITDYQGNPLSKERNYQVSMNDYILNTYKFDHKDKGEDLGIITAEVIIEYLKKGPVNYSGVQRTFIEFVQ
jgi:5'-nucleotidase / UDP-sugar diphosphatase